MFSRIGLVVAGAMVLGACAASRQEPTNNPHAYAGESGDEGTISTTTLTSAEANDGWSRYQEAVGLQKQGRTDAALSSYRDAESYFSKSGDKHGSSVAIYGRAHALDEAGRCDEAREAYHQYADLMKPTNPHAAELAIGYAHECQPVLDARVDNQANGWPDYNRAVKLDKAAKYNDSIAAYTKAEQAFAHDRKNRALALYGRARAETYLGKCDAANRDYQAYADLVRADNGHAADVALSVSRDCITR